MNTAAMRQDRATVNLQLHVGEPEDRTKANSSLYAGAVNRLRLTLQLENGATQTIELGTKPSGKGVGKQCQQSQQQKQS